MKDCLAVVLTRTRDACPLAVLDLPGDGAELTPGQLRHLAAALAGMGMLHRRKPPAGWRVIEGRRPA